MNRLHNAWNGAFNFSSLAGMLYLGVKGFQAAHHHAPNTDGRERYVYFAFPHIAIDENGTFGNCRRTGRQVLSQACGALSPRPLSRRSQPGTEPRRRGAKPPKATPVWKIWIRRNSRLGHFDQSHPTYHQRRS
ncbi:MAG: hypothetical protein KC588_06945 [Nitrospira sp.]|nr:hypothetical protein [Nitrospira sp.]